MNCITQLQVCVDGMPCNTNLFENMELPDDFNGEIGIAIREEGCATRMIKCVAVAPAKPTKSCIVCGKELEGVLGKWDHMQPMDGGEVKMNFSYGSDKDNCGEGTYYSGVICDECADQCIKVMEEKNYAD